MPVHETQSHSLLFLDCTCTGFSSSWNECHSDWSTDPTISFVDTDTWVTGAVTTSASDGSKPGIWRGGEGRGTGGCGMVYFTTWLQSKTCFFCLNKNNKTRVRFYSEISPLTCSVRSGCCFSHVCVFTYSSAVPGRGPRNSPC